MTHRRALLILGMHRSGTSALARMLNLFGADLPADVLPANEANVTGYWEPAAVVSLHDHLLADAGSRWDDPTEFPAAWFTSDAGERYARELSDVIAASFGSSPLMVIKDPRACRLVPLWGKALSMLEVEPLVLMLLRHPIEVAASLRHRDDMPESYGLMLWLQHVLAAEADTRPWRRLILSYDDLLDDWAHVIRRVRTELDVPLREQTPEIEAQICTFLDPALRHQRVADLAGRPDLPEWVGRVQAWFERARGGDQPHPQVLDEVRAEIRQVETIYAPIIRAKFQERSELFHRLQIAENERSTFERRLEERDRQEREQTEQWQAREREWKNRHDAAVRAQVDLQRIIDRMQRHPAWRALGWMARQRARVTGRSRS